MARIQRQTAHRQGHAPGRQQQRVHRPGSGRIRHQRGQQPQQGRAGPHASADPADRFGAVQHPFAVDQHRAIPQRITAAFKRSTQGVIGAAVTDAQTGDAAAQLAQLGEVAAEQAAAVEHQQRASGRMGIVHPVAMPLLPHPSGGDAACTFIVGTWRGHLRQTGLRAAVWLLTLLLALALPATARADRAAEPSRFLCDGEPLTVELVRGAVDAIGIPNSTAGTVPGSFVVLEWRQVRLQLPRSNDAGAPVFSDGKWLWSEEDPQHPLLRLRRSAGDVQTIRCESTA